MSQHEIQGQAAPGIGTGEAMTEIENLIAQLPPGIGFEWTGISLQGRQSGNFAPILTVSIVVVFLFWLHCTSWSIRSPSWLCL